MSWEKWSLAEFGECVLVDLEQGELVEFGEVEPGDLGEVEPE